MPPRRIPVPSAEVIDRETRALELARMKVPWPVIAKEVGFAERGAAHHAVQRALRRNQAQPAAELRDMMCEQLDAIERILWPLVHRQDLKALDRLLRVFERRARLLGLDHADGLYERQVAADERMAASLEAAINQALSASGFDADQVELFRRNLSSSIVAVERLQELAAGETVDAEIVEDAPTASKPAGARVKPGAPADPPTRGARTPSPRSKPRASAAKEPQA